MIEIEIDDSTNSLAIWQGNIRFIVLETTLVDDCDFTVCNGIEHASGAHSCTGAGGGGCTCGENGPPCVLQDGPARLQRLWQELRSKSKVAARIDDPDKSAEILQSLWATQQIGERIGKSPISAKAFGKPFAGRDRDNLTLL